MNKICTSIEQSKKLIELGIDVNTADMYYSKHSIENYYSPIPFIGKYSKIQNEIPCWSLAALLAQMPCVELQASNDGNYRAFWHEMYSNWHDNAVDACVELLERVRKENG